MYTCIQVLGKGVLRRTKAERQEELALPHKRVLVRMDAMDAEEQSFYNSLYRQSAARFSRYVSQGTLLHNYAHVFELLAALRQACNHPYLVLLSKNVSLPSDGRHASGLHAKASLAAAATQSGQGAQNSQNETSCGVDGQGVQRVEPGESGGRGAEGSAVGDVRATGSAHSPSLSCGMCRQGCQEEGGKGGEGNGSNGSGEPGDPLGMVESKCGHVFHRACALQALRGLAAFLFVFFPRSFTLRAPALSACQRPANASFCLAVCIPERENNGAVFLASWLSLCPSLCLFVS